MACRETLDVGVEGEIVQIAFIEKDAGHAGIENHGDKVAVEIQINLK